MAEQFQQSGERQRGGGGSASITIAECPVTGIEPALGWVTYVEITEENPHRRGMLAIVLPQHEVAAEFLQGTFRLVVQVDDRATAIEVPKSHEVVSSKKFFFVLNRSTWAQDVKPSQDHRTTAIHVPKCKGIKFHPESLVQDNVHTSKVLNPAMELLKAKIIELFGKSLEVLQFIFAWSLA